MAVSSCLEARARWRKRKRDSVARKSKLKEQDDDILDDNDDDDDPDLDPPQNHLESEDDPQIPNSDRTAQIIGEKGDEKLVAGGLKLCEFPVAIKREIFRPHSSVFRILEYERAARFGDSRAQGQSGVPVLENISYGQLQALSAVPRDNPSLLGVPSEETASGSGGGSYVITPPRIVAGSGVTKRLGSAGRVHVLPVHSEWFSPSSVHRLERQVVPHFFSGKSTEHTPEKYMECRNFIVAKYMENPEKHLAVANCQGLVAGIDNEDLTRIVRFLDHWGIINYCATPPKHEAPKEGTYLSEDSNNELRVPLAALKSIDSLIKFDKPKCRLKATDVYPELANQQEEDSDFDSVIREQLSEHQCNCCSRPISAVYYQSQKEVDVRLCLDCYQEGGFVAGHSSLDFMKENYTKDYGDLDGDSWSDQETLLLLEGMQLYSENWNKIAEHVGSKSKAQCILHFVRLPLDGAPLDNIDVPSTSGSSSLSNHDGHGRSEPNSNGTCLEGEDTENKFPFSSSGNPVMSLVAFIASALGPRVAAACAHASLGSLSTESGKEGHTGGPLSQHDAEGATLSAEKVISAAEDGLDAAAMKSKLFADHEEREIQRLSANIINHQLKRLELKLKQFAEIETLLMRECEQMERTRQRIAAERGLMMSGQFGSAGVQRPMGLPVVSNAAMNNSAGNSRQQHVQGSHQPFVSGYGNTQPIHPHMSLMQQQQQQHQQQQQGMYGLGPRLPLSAIHPSSSAPNAMFNLASNSQPSLGHPMLRPLSGTKSGLG
ncbi:SWI/SNF complex subunit SWI3C-like isoform X1 [Salvia hispanica]|uniref:SWI/SNF complex subunit SWI3C-like isoform X1 n=1 Tax=Salvia hispanica TaxID=49212 RepID=UPI0020090450|nr:SWI/SNF complex subunit SWI3C-like isoform X1 [Salvia hispanica]